MARVRPFHGIYYTERAGRMAELVAPPYDVLSPEEADDYRRQHAANVVHISVSRKGDPGFYAEAARLFEDWRNTGLLGRASRPGVYFYETRFAYTLGGGARSAERRGFFCLLGLADYSAGEVLRHERTLKAPKQDQLNLLTATRANLSPIFCLYSDPELRLISRLAAAKPEKPVYEFDFAGFKHRLFGIYDPELIAATAAALEPEKVYIADGHHRYETALEYSRRLRAARDPLADAAGHVMSFLCPLEDPGLVIFPYHRLLRKLPEARLSGLMEKLPADFKVQPLADHFSPETAAAALRKLEALGRAPGLAMFDAANRSCLLELKPERARELSQRLEVEVLEELILKKILGISQEELAEHKFVDYETSEQKLVERMGAEKFQLVFLVKPIPVWSMAARAERGEVMPEKSTYFYPKLPSGMIFRKLERGPDLS